ncbi:FMR1-like protein [Mya arenaria]|uniref:FMR1-like protein n=1 Tax=Mya arenaria TaxID=6604 RepID=A0ABY7ELT7_MYAAR|nr:FMR1-like protein [Mya arenaria]
MFCLKDNNEALNSLFDILKDVCSIEEEVDGSDDGSTVTHVGGIAASDKHKTEEVCKRAREMLEYAEETYQVPMDLVARVIGMKGKNIQDIVDKSGILRVKIDGAKKGDESRQDWLHRHATFTFVGTVMNISNAQMLLEYSIDHLRDQHFTEPERVAVVKNLTSPIIRKI